MDYIEKESIIDFIQKGLNNPDKEKAYGHEAIEILAEIEFAPTADVQEVKHGRWVPVEYTYFGAKRYECSECRDDEFWKMRFVVHKENYCPNCGAKMDGKVEDDG